LGASPIWQIALERCLTEAFQGQYINQYYGAVPLNLTYPFDEKMNFDNHMNIVRRSKGQYPPSLFDDEFDYKFNGFPEVSFNNQKDMMRYLITLIKNLGHNIYIRDVSFLKFNAYQIIVPGANRPARNIVSVFYSHHHQIGVIPGARPIPFVGANG